MNVGFIGTGSMGSVLIEAFIQSGALTPDQIIASNRTRRKAELLASNYPGMRIVDTNTQVFLESNLVFLCIKPSEYKKVIDEVAASALPTQLVVSITSPVLIRHLEDHLSSKIVKMIPSITNYHLSGATLCVYGTRVLPEDKELLEGLLGKISTPLRVDEAYTRVCSDLSSCGPAFLSYFIQKFIEAAVIHTGIPTEIASRLTSEMTLGTGELLTSGEFTPQTLQQRVAVPGGITAEGLKLLAAELDDVFQRLLIATHTKYDEDVRMVEEQFYGTRGS